MRSKVLVTVCVLALAGGFAYADSLAVNAGAAMGGTNFGMAVSHDNSSVAYVQDDTPAAEAVYRAEFLFSVDSLTTTANFRQPIFNAYSPNPNPGAGVCPTGAWTTAFRVFWYQTGGIGQNSNIQAFIRGNLCGEAAVARIPVMQGTDYRICAEWGAAGQGNGYVALAVVAAGNACPASGTAGWNVVNTSNQLTNVEFVRMGTPQTNGFGAGETGTVFFDEFASFRTVAP